MSSIFDTRAADACPSFLKHTGPISVLDVETVVDRVVEIAILRVVPGEHLALYTTLVDPGFRGWTQRQRRRADFETRVHRITPAMVKGKPTFLDLVPVIRHMCAGTTVVSHNASYERRIMSKEFERFGQTWDYRQICTLKLARLLYPGRREGRGYSLGALATDFQIPHVGQHRAAGDVCALVLVLWRMLEALGSRADVRSELRACTLNVDPTSTEA